MTTSLLSPTYPLSSTPAPVTGFAVYLGAGPNMTRAGSVSIDPRWVPVADLSAASEALCAFRDSNDLGSSNLLPAYVAHNGQLVAKVSYNGRVWEVRDGKETGAELGSSR